MRKKRPDGANEDVLAALRQRERDYNVAVIGPTVLGYLASWWYVWCGPHTWWLNMLIAGVVWGVTWPLRRICHQTSLTASTWYRTRYGYAEWMSDFRGHFVYVLREFEKAPLTSVGMWVLAIVIDLFWPVVVPEVAVIYGNLETGT